MEDIKVGEYVRTNRGVIYQYTEDEKNDIMLQDFRLCNDGKILEHSPYIIDLVHKGDYVNGKPIEDIINYKIGDTESRLLIFDKKRMNGVDIRAGAFYEDDINSVVTKEQFNQVKYEV